MNYLRGNYVSAASAVVVAAFLFSAAFTGANALVSPVTGKATKCTAIISCSFNLTSSNVTGPASTSGYVGGYVGQNLTFSAGSVNFRLPGETNTTYASGVYSGTANVTGSSATAGTIYHVTGKFTATDTNTGKIVKGSTDYKVGVKSRSGRGGGNTWTLVGGKMVINVLNIDGTSTSMVCNPSYTLNAGDNSICSVTVTDLNKVSGTIPTGVVHFSSSNTAIGTLSTSSCTLSAAGSCSVTLISNPDTDGGYVTVTAHYVGDSRHLSGSASNLFSVVGCQTC